MDFAIEVAAGLVAAAIAGAIGYALRGTRFKKAIKDAPSVYVDRLGKLIDQAYREGIENVIVNAQAIVSVRNEMRASLVGISQNLNSEISMLQALLYDDYSSYEAESTLKKFLETRGRTLAKADPGKLFQQIQVLHKTWPEKKVIIEIQIRKLMAELGLEKA